MYSYFFFSHLTLLGWLLFKKNSAKQNKFDIDKDTEKSESLVMLPGATNGTPAMENSVAVLQRAIRRGAI